MEWNPFSFDYRSASTDWKRIMVQLVEIESGRKAVEGLLLPGAWTDQLDRRNRARTIHGTTALEGNPLSEARVEEHLEHGAGFPAPTREIQQIVNADVAQEWVRSRFGLGEPPLTISDVLRMHALMTRHSDETGNVPGRLRKHSVVVGSEELGGVHRGAPHEDLPRLMEGFGDFVASRRLRSEHPAIQALLAHFFLVTIHPFGDGNGRVSRLVEAAVLYEGGYDVPGFFGLSHYFHRHAGDYRGRLQACRRERPFDVAPFVEFGLRGLDAEVRGIHRFIRSKLSRLVYRATLAGALAKRVGRRRRLIKLREHSLLEFLLEETEPSRPLLGAPDEADPARGAGSVALRQGHLPRRDPQDLRTRTRAAGGIRLHRPR